MEYVELTLKIPKDMKNAIKNRVIDIVKDMINDNTYIGAKARASADKRDFEQVNQGV